jgi:hypothetical protein
MSPKGLMGKAMHELEHYPRYAWERFGRGEVRTCIITCMFTFRRCPIERLPGTPGSPSGTMISDCVGLLAGVRLNGFSTNRSFVLLAFLLSRLGE